MREYFTVITRKGQITLPAEIRRAMALRQGDRVAVTLSDDGVARVSAAGSVIARTAGMFKSSQPPLTAEELREAAEEAIAAEAVERSR